MKKSILHALSGCGLLTGASYPFRILIFFKQNPSLWSYIIIPLILNLILGIFFYLQLLSWEAEFFEIFLSSFLSTIFKLTRRNPVSRPDKTVFKFGNKGYAIVRIWEQRRTCYIICFL